MFCYHEKENAIETERLLLRRFALSDAARVAEICNDDAVYRNTLALPHPYTVDHAVGWIQTHDANFAEDRFYDYAVTDKHSGTLYGCMGLCPDGRNRCGELGYWMAREHWGKGYATEAARAMIELAFAVKGLHRVYARHYASNPASGRVMQKCGMTYEGTQREHIYKIDHFEDLVLYGILNDR